VTWLGVLAEIEEFVRTHTLAIWFASYAIGIMAYAYHAPIALVVCGALVLTVTLALSPVASPTMTRTWWLCAACVVAGAFAASAAESQRQHAQLDAFDGHHITCVVEALERARPSSNGLTLRARILGTVGPAELDDRLRGRVALLEMSSDIAGARLAGNRLRVRARIDAPTGPRNDGEPSERDQLDEQGVSLILTVHRAQDLVELGPSTGWNAWWARLRARFAEAVESRLPPLEATVLEGVLWGDRGNLPASLRQEFSDTGTVHVLTTAGLHLGIMAALVAMLLALTPLPRPARSALVVAAGWAYAALAGLHIPTLRAATMLTAGMIAFESGRGRTASAVLAAAAFAVVLPHPLALLSPSFAMSFACVGGIALLGPALTALGIRAGAWGPHWFAELLRTGVSVQVALAPLQALYFNAFTPYAVAANLVVVPMVGAVMALGSAYAVAALVVPPLAWPLSNLTWWCVTIMTGAVDRFATLPFAHVDVPPPTHAFLVLYWIALAALAWAVRAGIARRTLLASGACAIGLLVAVYCAPGASALLDPALHLDAIDVGQADCLLVRAPGMHAMLVDGGGKLERMGTSVVAQPIGDRIATRTVMPFLLRHWVLRLDAVVLTHPHGDHAGGLPVILSRESVGTVWDSAQLYSGPAYQRALDVVRERHLGWRRAIRGESFDLGAETHVKILAPELPLITSTSSDINNNSVVLRVEFGRTAMLLTGDAQAEAEARLLSHGGDDLRADILKVGHHGSAYSSTPEFLAAVRPKVAIISCGRHNVFGHPSPRTLAALRTTGASIFRTDLNGGISIAIELKGDASATSVGKSPVSRGSRNE
jgi:competence protein ComEC